MTIKDWQRRIHATTTLKGFYDHKHDVAIVEKLLDDSNMSSSVLIGDEYEAVSRILADYKQLQIERKLLLTIGELCEAHEELRRGHDPQEVYHFVGGVSTDPSKPEGFGIEIADAVIRALDLSEEAGNDVESHMEQKQQFNEGRPYKHGRKF